MKTAPHCIDVETRVPADVFIYSRTDLQGNIVEANEAFAKICGYPREQMLGQPHNLVRHPDMPREAFADLWRNLKAGRPWKGVVKNRRADGGYYWVEANVSPVREQGVIVGYQSVRSAPSRAQIDAAEAAYRRLRAGATDIRVEEGRVVPRQARWRQQLCSSGFQLGGVHLIGALAAGGALWALQSGNSLQAQIASVLCILALVALGYLQFVLLPRNARALHAVADTLQQVLEGGDMQRSCVSARTDVSGRIANQLDTLLASMRATLHIIRDNTHHVANSNTAVAGEIRTLLDACRAQSDYTTETAATAEEMSVSISEVATHAKATRDVAQETSALARVGAEKSESATRTIAALAAAISASAASVEQLGRRAIDVSAIANVIREIAEQTNLLALNAAIEAARAGDSGRGFSVVADEVRKLAERTARATAEIDQTLGLMRKETEAAVEGMRDSGQRVVEGAELARDAHDELTVIVQKMAVTMQMVSEITHSTSEQHGAMSTMAQGIERVAALTEENLRAVGESGQRVDALEDSVQRMSKAVGQYRA
ncbi:PAS domain-containing methyl-accepting chemotaxis protein [Niveibacterium sp. SC-1]|uniref:methyl-accepting chemotaxis protein n=1 Tax=Niveibacterium sp. SC-1 TaxID=3135646 RepID=UPI00311E00E5